MDSYVTGSQRTMAMCLGGPSGERSHMCNWFRLSVGGYTQVLDRLSIRRALTKASQPVHKDAKLKKSHRDSFGEQKLGFDARSAMKMDYPIIGAS